MKLTWLIGAHWVSSGMAQCFESVTKMELITQQDFDYLKKHRLVEVGRDIWRSSGPIPCSSMTIYSPWPRPGSFWISPWLETPQCPWATCNSTPPLSSNSVCLFREILLFSSLWPLPLALSLGTTGKSLSLSSLHPSFRNFCTLVRSPWLFLAPNWTVSAFPHSRDAPVPQSP